MRDPCFSKNDDPTTQLPTQRADNPSVANAAPIRRSERTRLQSADELMTSLTAVRAAAQAEWTVGQRTLARHRELQHELGKQVERMEQVLLAFRTTLEEVLGVDHRDCQMLRTPRRKPRGNTEVSDEPETNDENTAIPAAAE